MSSPLGMASIGVLDPSTLSSLASVLSSSNHSSFEGNDEALSLLESISSLGSLGLSSSGQSPSSSFSSTGILLSSEAAIHQEAGEYTKSRNEVIAGLGAMAIALSAGSDPALAAALHGSFNNDSMDQVKQLAGIAMPASLMREKSEPAYIHVGKNTLKVGSIGVRILEYRGKTPYAVNGGLHSHGEILINPGDPILSLHVNQNAKHYKQMQPIERMRNMRKDLRELFQLLDTPEAYGLNEAELALLQKIHNAPTVGISHLAQFSEHKGLPTWDLSILPAIVQKFFAFDSAAVSKMFGGTRTVGQNDVRMTMIPANMRQILTA